MSFMQISLVLQIDYIKQMDHCILQLCYMFWIKGFSNLFKYPEMDRKEGQEQPSGGTPPWYTLPLYCILRVQRKGKTQHPYWAKFCIFLCCLSRGHKAVGLARSRVTTTSTETAPQRVPCWVSQWRHQMWPGDICGHLSASRASLPPGRITTFLGLLGHIGLMT